MKSTTKVLTNNNVSEPMKSSKTIETTRQTTTDATPSKTDPAVYLVFASLLMDLLAFTIILPLLPSILEMYRTKDSSGLYVRLASQVQYFQQLVGAPEKYNSVLFGGFLGSMFSFLQFVVSPIMGGLSDYYGRKPILLVSLVSIIVAYISAYVLYWLNLYSKLQVGIACSYGLWAISSNFLIFVIARFVGGMSKGNISLSMAIITDVSDEKNRNRAMALVGIAFSLGFIVGPMIGAFFSMSMDKTSTQWYCYPAMFAMFLAISDVLFISICLKETLPKVIIHFATSIDRNQTITFNSICDSQEKRAKEVVNSLSRAVEHISIGALFKWVCKTQRTSHQITTTNMTFNACAINCVLFYSLSVLPPSRTCVRIKCIHWNKSVSFISYICSSIRDWSTPWRFWCTIISDIHQLIRQKCTWPPGWWWPSCRAALYAVCPPIWINNQLFLDCFWLCRRSFWSAWPRTRKWFMLEWSCLLFVCLADTKASFIVLIWFLLLFSHVHCSNGLRSHLHDNADIALWQSWSEGHCAGNIQITWRSGQSDWTNCRIDRWVELVHMIVEIFAVFTENCCHFIFQHSGASDLHTHISLAACYCCGPHCNWNISN